MECDPHEIDQVKQSKSLKRGYQSPSNVKSKDDLFDRRQSYTSGKSNFSQSEINKLNNQIRDTLTLDNHLTEVKVVTEKVKKLEIDQKLITNSETLFQNALKDLIAKHNFDLINKDHVATLILEALLLVNDEDLAGITDIPKIVASSFKAVNKESITSNVSSMWNNLIGKKGSYYDRTLVYIAALEKENPAMVEKFLKLGEFNNALLNPNILNYVRFEIKRKFADDYNLLDQFRTILGEKFKGMIKKDEIASAIRNNNIDMLIFFLCSDKKIETNAKVMEQIFDVFATNSGIQDINFLFEQIENKKAILEIAEKRKIDFQNEHSNKIYRYIDKNYEIYNDQNSYQNELFKKDKEILNEIYSWVNKICLKFRVRARDNLLKTNIIFENDKNYLLPEVDEKQKEFKEFELIAGLKKIVNLIKTLNSDEKGIKNNFKNFPWIKFHLMIEWLVNEHKIYLNDDLDLHSLFEQLSPVVYALKENLKSILDYCNSVAECEKTSVDKTEKEFKRVPEVLNSSYNDCQVIKSTLRDIHVLETLDLSNGDHRYSLFQCLQSVGEHFKKFSVEAKTILKDFKAIKKFRDDLAHVWNKQTDTKMFFTLLESKTDKNSEDFLRNWKSFVDNYKIALEKYNESSTNQQINPKIPETLETFLDKAKICSEVDAAIPRSDNMVIRQMNIVKYAIDLMQKTVKRISKDTTDYQEMRDAFKSPEIHYKFLFLLTIIGKSVSVISDKADYIGVAGYDLLAKLDFLRWVRNSLMHSQDVNETGSLMEFLSNDLLMDFSLGTHGQKIVELHAYFEYVLELVNEFLQTANAPDNCYEGYDKNGKIYLKNKKENIFDIEYLSITEIVAEKEKIERKCNELGITVEGAFGKLVDLGYMHTDDSSGILVRCDEDRQWLKKTADLKQFLSVTLNFRIKVVEMRQLIEYLNIKVADSERRNVQLNAIKQKINKCTLDKLDNNIKLIRLLEDDDIFEDPNKTEEFIQLVASDRCCFDLKYPYDLFCDLSQSVSSIEDENYFYDPVLHRLFDLYTTADGEECQSAETLMIEILSKGADVNISNKKGDTLLHRICREYNENVFKILKSFSHSLNTNLKNVNGEVALQIALEHKNDKMIEFLKDKTNYFASLLISGVQEINKEYVEYLLDVRKIDANVFDENGTSVVCFAAGAKNLYIRYKSDHKCDIEDVNRCKDIVRLLLKKGAEVRSGRYFHPLESSLKYKDLDLSILLAEKSTNLDEFSPKNGIHPIHMAIKNGQELSQQSRTKYLELIKIIADRSKENLNREYMNSYETPLFLAAKDKDLDVMKIVVDSGANLAHKIERISQITCEKGYEDVVKFFVERDIRVPGVCLYIEDYRNMFDWYRNGETERTKRLIVEKRLHLNASDENGRNIFWHAVQQRDRNFIEWLAEKGGNDLGIDFDIEENGDVHMDKWENRYQHVSEYANGAIMRTLHNAGAIDWNRFDAANIETISRNAFANDDLEAIQVLEEHCSFALPDERIADARNSETSQYAEPYRIVFNSTNSLNGKDLLENVSELKNKLVFYRGSTLLHFAVETNSTELLELLFNDEEVKKRANVKNTDKETALDLAVKKHCRIEVVQLLIRNSVQIGDNFPINEYLELKDRQTYDALLEYIKTNVDFKIILFKAIYVEEKCYLKNPNYVDLLLKIGVTPNTPLPGFYWTILHGCASKGYYESVKFLCETGQVNYELPVEHPIILFSSSGYMTAVGFALENKRFDVAKLLIEKGASPFKYLSTLLLVAFRTKDIDFANLLLEKSALSYEDATKSLLDEWLDDVFTVESLQEAVDFYRSNKNEIKYCFPDYIYDEFEDAIKRRTAKRRKLS